MIELLAERVWDRDEFQQEYRRLLRRGIQEYVRIDTTRLDVDEEVLLRLLQSATCFAATNDPRKKEAAYRIAACSWGAFRDRYGPELRELLHVILGRLGNFPGVRFLFQNAEREVGRLLDFSMWVEITHRETENAVQVTDNREITLTDFQRRLWGILTRGKSATVSAPTSAGKSYALQNYLAGQLVQKDCFLGLYIVPTRALIHQVSRSLRRVVASLTDNDILVLTIPVPPSQTGMTRGLYVLTQERLQILFEAAPTIAFSMVVVDEAQTVSSDSRGIILQTVIDQLRRNSPEAQFLFSSPGVSNPQVFELMFDLSGVERVQEFETPVAQNVIFLDSDPTVRDEVKVRARIRDRIEPIGSVKLDDELTDQRQTLAYLSWHFGREDQNLVYVGSPAACEVVANMISDLIGAQATEIDPEVIHEREELASFLRDHVHPHYLLANTVLNGVAFHYGQMPSIVRQTLEDYFDEGWLNYLVSTTTLLHGVNLPAKNLFLLDPTKGARWPSQDAEAISGPEFWNLAGRAGRLGREFEGNVFIIDQSHWKLKLDDTDRLQKITPALDEQVKDKRDELLKFIKKEDHPSGKQQALETAFVRMFNEYRRGTLDRTLTKIFGNDINSSAPLRKAILEAAEKISLPSEITDRHITVSVYRQQEMFDYLKQGIKKQGPDPFIPLHPRTGGADAYSRLQTLLHDIHQHFEGLPKSNKSHTFYAQLAWKWMRGTPLPKLISDSLEYKTKHAAKTPSVGTVIREMMSNIENDLCFRYVKYTRCYIDILRHVLNTSGHSRAASKIPNIPLYLELGASSQTMVSLIGLGLSRTTAGILSDLSPKSDMDTPLAKAWLQRQNLEGLGVPAICIREVQKMMLKKQL
jgi:DEAD/DEAH box helicase